MITCEQIKAARAMTGLSQKHLALEAGVSIATLNNIERGVQTDPKVSTIRAIQETLESHGILFTHARDGVGLVLKARMPSDTDRVILIVDDSKEDRALYKKWLGRETHKRLHIVEADNARDGYGAFLEHRPDCIILDFKMYGTDGFQLLAEMRKDHAPLPPIIFVTGMHNDVLKESAERQGVAACLDKRNLTPEVFYDAVERAIA